MTTITPIKLSRKTNETDIQLSLNLSGSGILTGGTGVGFFDHMLNTLVFYAQFDLELSLKGDFHVDQHHSLEDLGILLGRCLKLGLEAQPNLRRKRYAHCYLPMDESLVRVVLDISGRPYLVYNLPPLTAAVGAFETACLKEFLRAFAQNAELTLHIEGLYGDNSHHLIEALFKGLGLCLKDALSSMETLSIDSQDKGPNSTKGLVKEVL